MVEASPATEPISVENIKLNCLTSVQFLEPETGQTISNSTIKSRTASRSLFSNAAFIFVSIASIFS